MYLAVQVSQCKLIIILFGNNIYSTGISIAECSISVVITVPVTAIITAIITIIIMHMCVKHYKKTLSTELEMMSNAAYGQVIPAELHSSTVYETPYI